MATEGKLPNEYLLEYFLSDPVLDDGSLKESLKNRFKCPECPPRVRQFWPKISELKRCLQPSCKKYYHSAHPCTHTVPKSELGMEFGMTRPKPVKPATRTYLPIRRPPVDGTRGRSFTLSNRRPDPVSSISTPDGRRLSGRRA